MGNKVMGGEEIVFSQKAESFIMPVDILTLPGEHRQITALEKEV